MKQGIAYRPLADMETNGIYFERDEVEICEYSGLPSVKSYEKEEEKEEEHVVGHS